MHRHLLKTASVFAFVLLAAPAFAQSYSADNAADPYGYGNVPLPPPLPAFQAQQTSAGVYMPLGQYAPQYATAVYAGQSVTQPVNPNYLPATRPQASQVGYSVQAQSGQLPQVTAQAQQGYTQSTTYGTQGVTQAYATQPQQQYAVQYQQPQVTASVQAQPAYQQQVYAPTPSYQAPAGSYTTPTYDSGSYQNSSSYQATTTTTTTTTPSYQVATATPTYQQQPAYQQQATTTYQSPSYQTQGYQTQTTVQGQPQVETYPYSQQQQPSLSTQPAYESASSSASMDTAPSLSSEPGQKRWYFALRTGVNVAQDTTFRRGGADWENEFYPGWQLGGALGYDFNAWNSWLAPRAEVEMTYDQSHLDNNKVAGVKTTDPDAFGFKRGLDLLANGYLDMRLSRYFQPYVGAGIGIGYSDFDRIGNSATGSVMDDNDVGFVWQAMAGLSFNLSNYDSFDVGYRYQQNTGLNLKARDGTLSTTDEGKHIFMIGLRQNF